MTAAKFSPTGKVPLNRSYDGEAGVQDTAEEVRALRQQGVRVAAVFMGENASAPRRTDDLWAGSGPYPTDGPALPPLPENSFRRRFGGCPGEHMQVYCKSYHFFLAADIKEKLQSQFLPFSLSKKSSQMKLHPIC